VFIFLSYWPYLTLFPFWFDLNSPNWQFAWYITSGWISFFAYFVFDLFHMVLILIILRNLFLQTGLLSYEGVLMLKSVAWRYVVVHVIGPGMRYICSLQLNYSLIIVLLSMLFFRGLFFFHFVIMNCRALCHTLIGLSAKWFGGYNTALILVQNTVLVVSIHVVLNWHGWFERLLTCCTPPNDSGRRMDEGLLIGHGVWNQA
jgi:hypothetical protein